jgi:tight adherence protein C
LIGALIVLIVSALGLMLLILFGRQDSVEERVDRVSEQKPRKERPFDSTNSATAKLPKMGAMLMPSDASKASHLKARLRQAGLYRRHSSAVYLGVKLVFMVAPMGVGVVLSALRFTPLLQGVLFGAVVGLVGNLVPSLWLNHLKRGRQRRIRRALPDALDVMVICLEGGLSLPAALAKVTSELRMAHQLLADELAIVSREIQLGRSTGEALRQLANRFDAEELRSLASVVVQAERFGASVVKAFRVHADSLRLRRYQYAEAQAQKAPVKLIFPTVLCIFPALYIVLMGPAGVQLLEMLGNLSTQ